MSTTATAAVSAGRLSAREARRIAYLGLAAALLGVLVCVLPGLRVETPAVPSVLALVGAGLGGLAVVRGARQIGYVTVVAALLCLLAALLIQHAKEETIAAIVTPPLFAATLRFATPLTFAAIGGLFSERSGVVNIGLEGMMLTGAFFGILVCDKTDSWEIGLLGAAAFGGLLALVHAFFSIHLRADQIVSGTAVNILAVGATTYAFRSLYTSSGTPDVPRIPNVTIPGVKDLRWIGPVVGHMNLMIWLMLVLVVLTWFVLFKTPIGLRLRAVGEHPRAADTMGIDVFRIRYAAVVVSGALAGLGGAYLSFGLLGSFTENMTAGQGFIALAALIFGKWRPFGAFGAALLFGFATALGNSLQTVANLNSSAMAILPYALTLIALVGVVGRSTPPAAVGRPYRKQ